jgi:cysteine desulfurase / selenocysteine lyase
VSELIYCDQAATSFPKPPSVAEAVHRAMTDHSASPGRSGHRMSLAASRLVFSAREAMAELLGVDDSARIIFTLNVTMALNVALAGLLQPNDHVLTTGMEHNSVMRPLNRLAESMGITVEVVPTASDGRVDPRDFTVRLQPRTALVVVNHVSNVTGTIQPIREIKTALNGIPLLVDTAQSAGVLSLDPAESLADLIAFTGHKSLFGPTGTGGLWVRPGLDLSPMISGGTGSRSEKEEHPEFMPDMLEAGTPNVHGLAGLTAGIAFIQSTGREHIHRHEMEIGRVLLDGLSQIRDADLYGPSSLQDRLSVISMNLKGWSSSALSRVLDREFGILTRPGLHCAPRAHRTIGTFPQGTVRFSFGWFNTVSEAENVLVALDRIRRKRP